MANETFNEPLKVFSQELTHFAENSGFYDRYANAARSIIDRNGQNYDYIKHQIIKDYESNGIELSDIDADKEVVAQFTQELIRNEEDLKALVKYDRNLGQRVLDWVKMQLSKLTSNVDLINARNILSKALNTTQPAQNNLMQYSVTKEAYDTEGNLKPLSQQWEEGQGDFSRIFVISDELKGLEEFGIENRAVAITWDVITKINKKHQVVEFEYLDNLGNLLEDAQYIVDGIGANKGNKLVVTTQKDNQDRFLVVAVEANKSLKNSYIVNDVRSVYGRNNLENYLINNSERVHEIKKSSSRARIQFPMQATTYDESIHDSDDSVKHFDDGSKKDLQALHNLNEDKLRKSLDLNGLPMPSLAITKDDLSHDDFGDISLVFKKDSIDPANKENKVYSKDVWSPMFPDVDILFDTKGMRIELNSLTNQKIKEVSDFIANFENYEYGITENQLSNIKIKASKNEMLREAYSKLQTNYSFEEWINHFLNKYIMSKGIHNGKDTYTNNGRRTFKQLHNEFSIENVLKDMKKQEKLGQKTLFASSNSTAGKFSKQFKSLEEIISNKELLKDVTENDFAELANNRLYNISQEIANPNASNSFIETERIARLIHEMAKNNLSISDVKSYFNNYHVSVTEPQAQSVLDYYEYLKLKPSKYFEAKPRRIVRFDEVDTAVIPKNTSQELKQKLLDKGIKIMEYDTSVDGDRHNIITSLDDTKFSIGKNYFAEDAEGKERYVLKVPNSMFIDGDGNAIPMEARKKILRRFLLDNYRGKLINVGDLYDAKFTSETASELSYKKALNQPIKNEVVTDIEPILKNAEYIETVEDYGHHPEAIDGWDYFKINFGIDDGHNLDKYKAKLSIMNTEKGPIIYEINEIKKDSTSEQSSNEPVASGAIAKYSLGQKRTNVNTINALNEKIINYDYSKRKLTEDIVAEGDAKSFDNTIDELSIKVLRNEDTSQLKSKIIDEALNGAKIKDRTINQRAKDVRKYINGYKDKTFYVNSNVAEELGYDNFTELNKDLGPINLSVNKGNKYTGNHYSAFETLYKEVSEEFGFDSNLNEASSVELIKQAVKLNDDKINLADVLGEDNFKRHLTRSLDEFEQRIKNSKLSDKERLERKSGKMELDHTFIENHQYAKDLPAQTDNDIEMFANYGFNKSSKFKTLDQNILDFGDRLKSLSLKVYGYLL